MLGNRDHFVPQFLLKNFSMDPKGKKSGLVYGYEKGSKKARERSIAKHAANEKDFYLGKNRFTKSPSKSTDNVYKEIEKTKHAPSVINKVLDQKEGLELSAKEESILATLTAHQYTRTKKFRNYINNFLTFLLWNEYITKDRLASIEGLREVVVENKYKITPDQISSDIPTSFLGIRGTRGQELILTTMIAESFVEELYRKNFHTIIAPEDDYFIISDSPVCVFGREGEILDIDIFWEFKRDDHYTFVLPISPKKAIVFGNYYPPYKQITDSKIAKSLLVFTNSISVHNTHEEFYSNKDTFWHDYSSDLITPQRLKLYRKKTKEIEQSLKKKISFYFKYLIWKVKSYFKNNR